MRAAQAFTSHMDVPDSAVLYYTVVKRDLDLIKSGCYIAMTVVSDALIVSLPDLQRDTPLIEALPGIPYFRRVGPELFRCRYSCRAGPRRRRYVLWTLCRK